MPQSTDPQSLQRLKRAVARLPRRDREVFLAHRLEGLSYNEIAERTGLSVQRVERHIASALYRLDRDLHGRPLRWWERLLGL